MVSAKTPTIAQIKNNVSPDNARALLSIAICEVCDFFNVGKNMNDVQIALTVDLIIERFWHLKIEEIKHCFRRAIMCEKLFDRLDGNIILGWLKAYEAERTEAAISLSEQEDARRYNPTARSKDAIRPSDLLLQLKQKSEDGDASATEAYENLKELLGRAHTPKTTEEEKKRAFRQWYHKEYMPSKTK